MLNAHKYTNSTSQTISTVFDAGMDIDCGSFVKQHLLDALNAGSITREDIVNGALSRLVHVQFRLGLFDPSTDQPYTKYPVSYVNSPFNQQLALDAARQGIVLLKNVDGLLPLDQLDARTVALIGPNAVPLL